MVWSCISDEGPGPIHFVEGTGQYINVLENVFLPYLNRLRYPASDYTSMQDGAPCHTSRASMNCINSLNLDVLPWPGNSPDLNLIENCWTYLKRKVYQRKNTIAILKENIKDVWENDVDLHTKIKNCSRISR